MSILSKVKDFLTSIDLNLSETKTKVTSLNEEAIIFLGTKIFRSDHTSYSRIGVFRRLRRNKLGLRLEAPIDRIRDKLTKASFIENGKSSPKFL